MSLKQGLILLLAILTFQFSVNGQRITRNPPPRAENIRQVDFKNFTYKLNGKLVRLRNGEYPGHVSPHDRSRHGYVMLMGGSSYKRSGKPLNAPIYGDLTNDGKDEAALVLWFGSDENPHDAKVLIYTLQNSRPELLATLEAARQTWGDTIVKIEEGLLIVQNEWDEIDITKYRWNGRRLVQVGETQRSPSQ